MIARRCVSELETQTALAGSLMVQCQYLVAWERGYTRAGWWSDDLAVAALKSLRYTRQRNRQARADAKTKKATGAKPTAARAKPKAAAAATKGGNKRTMPAEAPVSAGKRAQQR